IQFNYGVFLNHNQTLMKKLSAMVVALFVFASGVLANVGEKVLASFNKTFPSAENIKWNEDGDHYLVHFTQFGISTKVAYNHRGKFLYALRYYKQEKLPVSIVMTVREEYRDKNIFAVIEFSTAEDTEYHIKLEDAKNLYGIKVTSSGNISVEEH